MRSGSKTTAPRSAAGAVAVAAAIVAGLVAAAGRATANATTRAATVTPALNSTAIVARINAQRTAHGIPAGIRWVADWSHKCALHNARMKLNSRLQHPEEEGSPGYTSGGNWAGTHAVLAAGTHWVDGNPWETAPIHLIQLLGPGLARMGAAETSGYDCATTWPGYERLGVKNVVHSYPGDGTKLWRPSEVAIEAPFTPGEKVGIPAGTRTGPYLYLLPDGPWTQAGTISVTSASLSGPGGAVPLRIIDKRNADVGPYMPKGSAMLIPLRPLRGGSAYTVTTRLTSGTTALTKRWRFTTARENEVSQQVEAASMTGFQVVVTSAALAPDRDHRRQAGRGRAPGRGLADPGFLDEGLDRRLRPLRRRHHGLRRRLVVHDLVVLVGVAIPRGPAIPGSIDGNRLFRRAFP